MHPFMYSPLSEIRKPRLYDTAPDAGNVLKDEHRKVLAYRAAKRK